MAISEEAKRITRKVYELYGSDSGYLFGIPPEYRWGVEAVVQVVLERCVSGYQATRK